MKKIILMSVLAATAGLSTATWAAPGEGRGEGRMEGRGEGRGAMEARQGPGNPEALGARILQRLLDNPDKMKEFGITEDQAKALQSGFYDLEKKMVSLRSEAELSEIEVRRLMQADDADEAALMAAIDKAGQAQTAIRKAMASQRLAVQKILGPETAKKIKHLIGERMRQARGGGEDQGPRGRGPGGEDDDREHRSGKGKGAPWMKGQMEAPEKE